METVQGGVPPYGVKETLVVNGKYSNCLLFLFFFNYYKRKLYVLPLQRHYVILI